MLRTTILIAAIALGTCNPAWSATVHDESTQGDLSGNRLAPTSHTLQAGVNSIIAETSPGDLEYFTFVVPNGMTLSSIILAEFAGDSFVSFLAVQRGTSFTVAPDAQTAAGLLGWTHVSNVGDDLLPAMGSSGFGAEGFVPPLPAGNYTFWMQEIDAPVQYRLDFNVSAVPEPSLWLMLAAGLGMIAIARRRSMPPA